MTKTAVYAGTFDPITLGHVNIIERAAALFDHVVIGVADQFSKKTLYSSDKRMAMVTASVEHISQVSVELLSELAVDFAHQHQARYLIRGLRSAIDFDYESQMALMNQSLRDGIETVFLVTDPQYGHISSSIVREIISLKAFDRLSAFLPMCVIEQL